MAFNGGTFSSSDLSGYDDLNMGGSGRSQVVPYILGVVGAIVGALPGFLLTVFIGKLGYISSAIGLVMAAGIVFGFLFMTKNSLVSPLFGLIVCVGVMIFAVYLSQKIIWCWELADVLDGSYQKWRNEVIAAVEAAGVSVDLSDPEIADLLSEDSFKEATEEAIGFSDFSFSGCFNHFSKILEFADAKGKFTWSLVKSGLFSFLGGAACFGAIQKKAGGNGSDFI